jgi:hypothetical protein
MKIVSDDILMSKKAIRSLSLHDVCESYGITAGKL